MHYGRPAYVKSLIFQKNMSKSVIFGVHGVPLGAILGVLGWPGRLFGGSGGTPGRILSAVGAKDALPGSPSLHFERFLLQKGSQNDAKMKPKSLKSRSKNLFKNQNHFGWFFSWILVDF